MGESVIFFETYAIYIRIALAAAALAATAYFSAHWATEVNESKWQKKEAAAAQQVIVDQQESQRESAHAGALYELDRAKIQHVVSTPDRKLDALLQTSVGDVVIPGDLGVRLNAIASAAIDQASQAASGSDSPLPSASAVSDSERPASGVEAASGSQYRIGYRLPTAPPAAQ